jgi:hypothetical protein
MHGKKHVKKKMRILRHVLDYRSDFVVARTPAARDRDCFTYTFFAWLKITSRRFFGQHDR